MKKVFNGREIDVTDFDDVTSGEHVIEFKDPGWRSNEGIIAISTPRGQSWNNAVVSINPHKGDVPVSFVIWAVGVAEERMN